MRNIERQETLDPLGHAQRQQKRAPTAPVMRQYRYALELEHVEQCERVGSELFLVVWTVGGVGPAEAAQIRHQQAELTGEQRYDASPLVPMLRPAVQEQQRWTGTCLGQVHSQTARLHEAVLDAVDVRELRFRRAHAAAPVGTTSRRSATP